MNLNKKDITKQHEMKSAVIENIILWMVMFIGFATLFFFVIDYAKIIRIKDNMNALSDYSSRVVALNGTGNLTALATNLNTIKVTAVNTISAGDFNCNTVNNNTYQVIFTTITSNSSYEFFTDKLSSTKAVFNQVNSNTINCTLTITLSN